MVILGSAKVICKAISVSVNRVENDLIGAICLLVKEHLKPLHSISHYHK